jgi:hypothetical protein
MGVCISQLAHSATNSSPTPTCQTARPVVAIRSQPFVGSQLATHVASEARRRHVQASCSLVHITQRQQQQQWTRVRLNSPIEKAAILESRALLKPTASHSNSTPSTTNGPDRRHASSTAERTMNSCKKTTRVRTWDAECELSSAWRYSARPLQCLWLRCVRVCVHVLSFNTYHTTFELGLP